MSDSFEVQVRDVLTGRVADAPTAHEWAEVERRATGPDLPAPSPKPRPPVVVWLAVAAAAVLLVAGAVFVVRDDGDSVVIDEGPSTTVIDEPEPTVVENAPDDGALTVDEVDRTEPDQPEDEAGEVGGATASGGFAPIEPGTWHVAAAGDSSITGPEVEDVAGQVRSWPGVLSVEAAGDASDWFRLTGLDDSSCDGTQSGPPCGAGVVLLAVEGQHQSIGRRLESEFGMISTSAHAAPVEFVRAYLAAAVDRASPTPLRFDPTSLGREIPLTGPITDISAHPSCVEPDCVILDEITVEVDADGTLERLSLAILDPPKLLFPQPGGGFRVDDIETLLPGPGGEAGIWGSTSGPAVELAGLPLDVAVVTVELSDGSTVWQRPIGGMALLPFGPGTVTALDADGSEILIIGGGDPAAVTDLRVDQAQLAAAERDVAEAFEEGGRTVSAGDVTVTWVEMTWGSNEGPDWGGLSQSVTTPSGVLALREPAGAAWRWTDARRWERAAELLDYDIGRLVKGGDRVIASGRRRASDQPVLLSSVDGRTWTEIDGSALGPNRDHVVATSSSGLSVVGNQDNRGVVALIEEDEIVETYDPPWPAPEENLPHFFEVLDTDDGAVIVRNYWFDEADGSSDTASLAWRYLGGGEFAPPVTIPVSQHTARLGDMVLRFDGSDYLSGFGIEGETSEAPLLSSTNGTDWTNHSTLTSETRSGLNINSGDFFWVYGLAEGKSTMGRFGSFATIWVSTDASNWSPLDISFTASQSLVNVVGDTIFISDLESDDRWVGHVEPG